AHAAAAGGDDAVGHRALALFVDVHHGLDDPDGAAGLPGGFDQRSRVLGEAGAAEAGAGVKELAPDPAVEADAAGDVVHVRTDALAQIGDLVDEGDLGGEEGVGRIFGQLRRL